MKNLYSNFYVGSKVILSSVCNCFVKHVSIKFKTSESESVFKRCPKYGKIIGLNTKHSKAWFLIPLVGIPALIWFLIRVIPKPDRLTYPCMQVAAPIAASFVLWVAQIGFIAGGIVFIRKKATSFYTILALSVVLIVAAGTISMEFLFATPQETIKWDIPVPVFKEPLDINQPIGVGKGIFPGRVSWAHNPAAVVWNGTGNWYDDNSVNQEILDGMLTNTIISVGGGSTSKVAWNNIFKDFNKRKQKESGYLPGEKIAIKINLNNRGAEHGRADATPHLVLSMLKQLVNTVGVNAKDIIVYEAQRGGGMQIVKNYCEKFIQGVNYIDALTATERESGIPNRFRWIPNVVKFSSPEVSVPNTGDIPDFVYTADYLISMAMLKRHMRISDRWNGSTGLTALTLCAKNHFGTIRKPMSLHEVIREWHPSRGMGSYNPCVDIVGSKYLGGNTLLFILDGLFTSDIHNGYPKKWNMAPFNGHYPSSVFISQDALAIESVGLDFLRAEWQLPDNADNFIHEAALVENPPSGIKYQPDGVPLTSLGVHEHWNNSTKMQYSRNLGTGTGIELYKVSLITSTKKLLTENNGVFPNPFSDSINFISHKGTYKIIDLSGKVVRRGKTTIDKNTLNLSSLDIGTYFLHLTNSKGEMTYKIQKKS